MNILTDLEELIKKYEVQVNPEGADPLMLVLSLLHAICAFLLDDDINKLYLLSHRGFELVDELRKEFDNRNIIDKSRLN